MRSATRDPVTSDEVPALLEGVRELYVARGRKFVHVDLGVDRPPDDELAALVCGRSGKLRAPTLRSGDRILVGFNAEMLETVLRPEG